MKVGVREEEKEGRAFFAQVFANQSF